MLGHLGVMVMALWPCSSRNVVCLHGYPVWLLVGRLKEHEILQRKEGKVTIETQKHLICNKSNA